MVGPEITQAGISSTVEVRLSNLGRVLHPMLFSGEVRVETRRVKGSARRKKCYFLTDLGRTALEDLRSRMEQEWLEVPDLGPVTMGELRRRFGAGASAIEMLKKASTAPVRHLHLFPDPLESVIGRSAELAETIGLLSEGRDVSLLGLAGIGKTTLAQQVMDLVGRERDVLWWTASQWDSHTSLLAFFGSYLTNQGRGQLEARLEENEDWIVLLDDLLQAFDELRPLLIIDGSDLFVDRRVDEVLRVCVQSSASVMITAREPGSALKGTSKIRLGPLDHETAIALVRSKSDAVPETEIEAVVRHCGGHPLALLLARPQESWDLASQENLFEFVREEVAAGMSDDERACAELASIYTLPVDARNALEKPLGSRPELLAGLVKRSLMVRYGRDLVLQPIIRSYFRAGVDLDSREDLHRMAGEYYEDRLNVDPRAPLLSQFHLLRAGEQKRASEIFRSYRDDLLLEGYPALQVLSAYDHRALDNADSIEVMLAEAEVTAEEGRGSLIRGLEEMLERLRTDPREALWRGRYLELCGKHVEARDSFSSALDAGMLQPLDAARLHNNWGLQQKTNGNTIEASEHYNKARELFHESRHEMGQVAALGEAAVIFNTARLAEAAGDMEQTLLLAGEALHVAEQAYLPLRRLTLLRYLAHCYMQLGDLVSAESNANLGVNLAAQLNVREEEIRGRGKLVEIMRAAGRSREADYQESRIQALKSSWEFSAGV